VALWLPTTGELSVRDLTTLEPKVIATIDRLASLIWSPDSRELAFASEGAIWRIPATGGAPAQVCRLENETIVGAAWGANGRIVFGSWRGGL
jgi:hypothetical protein